MLSNYVTDRRKTVKGSVNKITVIMSNSRGSGFKYMLIKPSLRHPLSTNYRQGYESVNLRSS